MNSKPVQILSWINDFIDHWSERETSHVSSERRLEILRIAQQLADEDASAQTNLIAWLPPLLCRSQEQQERFVNVYETWRETSGVLEQMPTASETSFPPATPPPSSSRDIKVIAIISGVITLILILIFSIDKESPPPPKEPLLVIPDLRFSDSLLEQSTFIHAKNWQEKNWTSYRFELRYDTQFLKIEVEPLLGGDAKAEYTSNRIIIANGGQPIPVITADSFGFARLNIRWIGLIANDSTAIEFVPVSASSYLLTSDSLLTVGNGGLKLDGGTIKFVVKEKVVKKGISDWWYIVIVSLVIGMPLLLILLTYLYSLFQSEVTLNKRLPRPQEESFLSWLFFPRTLEQLPELRPLLPLLGRLHNWPLRGRKQFDVAATVKAVSAHAGNFVPIFTNKQHRPGFLVLIDRSSQRDQQADLSNAFIDKLETHLVRVTRYEFDEDPRQLWDEEGLETLIGTLVTNYQDHYLVIFSSLSGLYDGYTGELYEWATLFGQSWPQSYLFSPENPQPGTKSHKLGRYKQLSRLGFNIYPLSSVGVRDFIEERPLTVDQSAENALSHYLPASILNHWFSWSSIFPPPDVDIELLIKTLKYYLGNDGWRWLQACAPFPELHLELTIHLGQHLGREAYPKEPLYEYAVLLRLMQLPWFRQGSMPQWLREALIDDMNKVFRQQVKAVLNDFFASALKQEEKINKSLAAYKSPSWWESLQNVIIFKQFRKRQSPRSPFQEVIFADFVDNGIGARIKRTLLQTKEVLKKQDMPQQNDEVVENKELSIWEALFPVIILVVLLSFNVSVFGYDALSGSNQFILLIGGVFAAIVGFVNKVSYNKMLDEVANNIKSTTQAILILLFIGALAGTWLISGVIPSMVFYGLKIINPTIFLPATVVTCAIVSIVTGSSWTTSATVGIALIGIGQAIGIPLGMVAGAILSGAYFGNKMSPLSDTTNLAPAMAGGELFTHIRYMALTTIPTIIVTIIIFIIIGLTLEPNGVADTEALLATMEKHFYISPILFIVPIVVIFLITRKTKPLIALLVGTLLGGVFAIVFQPEVVTSITEAKQLTFTSAYQGVMDAMTVDVAVKTDNELLNELFSSSGMYGMLGTIWLIICAMVFGGIMDAIGALARISRSLLNMAESTFSLFASTVASCLALNVTASDQYLALVVPGKMFAKAYEDRGLAPENLSRTLEDSGTVTSVLIPWNTCGLYHSGVLGVGVGEYFIYAIFNWLSPFATLLFAALHIKIEMLVSKEEATPV